MRISAFLLPIVVLTSKSAAPFAQRPGEVIGLVGPPPMAFAGRQVEVLKLSILEERDMARDRFEAGEADIKVLVRQRKEAARACLEARTREFMAGRGTHDLVVYAQERAAVASDPLPRGITSTQESLEAQWRAAWLSHALLEGKYLNGRANYTDYFEAKYLLREIEIFLALTKPKKK